MEPTNSTPQIPEPSETDPGTTPALCPGQAARPHNKPTPQTNATTRHRRPSCGTLCWLLVAATAWPPRGLLGSRIPEHHATGRSREVRPWAGGRGGGIIPEFRAEAPQTAWRAATDACGVLPHVRLTRRLAPPSQPLACRGLGAAGLPGLAWPGRCCGRACGRAGRGERRPHLVQHLRQQRLLLQIPALRLVPGVLEPPFHGLSDDQAEGHGAGRGRGCAARPGIGARRGRRRPGRCTLLLQMAATIVTEGLCTCSRAIGGATGSVCQARRRRLPAGAPLRAMGIGRHAARQPCPANRPGPAHPPCAWPSERPECMRS